MNASPRRPSDWKTPGRTFWPSPPSRWLTGSRGVVQQPAGAVEQGDPTADGCGEHLPQPSGHPAPCRCGVGRATDEWQVSRLMLFVSRNEEAYRSCRLGWELAADHEAVGVTSRPHLASSLFKMLSSGEPYPPQSPAVVLFGELEERIRHISDPAAPSRRRLLWEPRTGTSGVALGTYVGALRRIGGDEPGGRAGLPDLDRREGR